jgi:hypothetical protein
MAVLGAGIMGACTALALARRGEHVTLFDREVRAVDRASRWNEGKIHLGYLYGADKSLATARHVLPGSLLFGALLSDLTGRNIADFATQADDTYFVHRNSVVSVDQIEATFSGVSELIQEHPDSGKYFVDVSRATARRLSKGELERFTTSPEIVAAFTVPERSVSTQRVADTLGEALFAEPRIELRLDTEITAVKPNTHGEKKWLVQPAGQDTETFDIVVNSLWNGRLEIDITAGLRPTYQWSNRYRLALFVHTTRDIDVDCGLIAVGPFGDVKSYTKRDFYLSWYPAGLVFQSNEVAPRDPRPISHVKKDAVIEAVKAELGGLLPMIRPIFDAAETIVCDGGFVYARGTGSIGDPASSLHRRDLFGVERLGTYFSVDTGKYATAPWLAEELAKVICGD